MHTLHPVNYLIKTTPEITLGLHFDSFKSQQSAVEKSQILSVVFHLSATLLEEINTLSRYYKT